MAARKRTDEEYREVTDVVAYELWMLCSTAGLLAKAEVPKGALQNAALESFLLHARALGEFLLNPHATKGRAIAAQFFEGARSAWTPPTEQILEETRNRTHDLLAHITFGRHRRKTTWNFVAVYRAMETAFRRFVAEAPRNRIGAKLRTLCQGHGQQTGEEHG